MLFIIAWRERLCSIVFAEIYKYEKGPGGALVLRPGLWCARGGPGTVENSEIRVVDRFNVPPVARDEPEDAHKGKRGEYHVDPAIGQHFAQRAGKQLEHDRSQADERLNNAFTRARISGGR